MIPLVYKHYNLPDSAELSGIQIRKYYNPLCSSVLLLSLLLLILVPNSHAQQKTEFSGENALHILHHLSVDIGPRVMGSAGDQQALQYAVGKFKEYGCDTAYVMPMLTTTRANTTSGIAVGIKYGTTKRIICIGGHIDSAGPEIPGADDDGSGSASVMELAHVLAKRNNQSTIVFCCFSGEEQGLEGSKYFADHFAQIDSIALMLQIDMANGLGIIDLDPDCHIGSAPKWLVRAAVEEFTALGYKNLRYPTHTFALNYGMPQGSGSDHESFLRKGIPAIDFSTDVTKPIHTPRDNFDNFEPGGLQRSGDLMVKLFERFDNGVPVGKIDHYWLYLIGATPIFLPLWALWTFDGISIFLCICAILKLYGKYSVIIFEPKIKWSRLKIFLFSVILICFAWYSPDVISLFQGVRHTWITHERLYFIYAAITFFIGVLFTARLTKKFPLTKSPVGLFITSAIFLCIIFLLLLFLGVKPTIYPALSLLFLSLAILIGRPSFKIVFLLLSPLPMLRMIFSEWSPMIMRVLGTGVPGELKYMMMVNGGFVLFFAVCLLPFVYAFVAVVRDTPAFRGIGSGLRSKGLVLISILAFIAMTVVLIYTPGYSNLWYKSVRISEKFDMDAHSQEVNIKSGDYLKGVHILNSGLDTTITSKTSVVYLTRKARMDTTWFHVDRKETKSQSGDTANYDITLTLHSKFRPYTITLTYDTGGKESPTIISSWYHYESMGKELMMFGSFPETNIVVPLKFKVVGSGKMHETISASFDSLAYPLQCSAEQTYFIKRTEFVEEKTYMK
ncbi:MAG: M28 family metallopeptidase [Bacteroidota bacterium]